MNDKPYILYADDYVMNQIIIIEMLQEYFEVRCINTGQDCLDSVAFRIPDLILLGKSMPLFDDYETKHILRSNTQYKEIPLISLFVSASENKIDIGCEIKHELYIEKPFDKNKLISTIQNLLSQTINNCELKKP